MGLLIETPHGILSKREEKGGLGAAEVWMRARQVQSARNRRRRKREERKLGRGVVIVVIRHSQQRCTYLFEVADILLFQFSKVRNK